MIVKPIRSTAKLFGRKAYILHTEAELRARFTTWPIDHDELVVQRYITGPLEQCDFVAVRGDVVAFFQAHAVRTDRPDGTGFAVDFLSDPPDEGVLAACRAFARAHDYTGPGLLQLVRSTEDGHLYFIENNPRLSAGIAQAVRCGLDMPYLMLQAASRLPPMGRTTPTSVLPYRVGHRTHWLSRDLAGYLDSRRELDATERCRWRRAIITSLARADDHMTWDLRDPAPSFWIYGRLLSRVLRAGTSDAA